MKKTLSLMIIIMATGIILSGNLFAQCANCADKCKMSGPAAKQEEVQRPEQSLCPVMGNPVNKQVYADYNGKRVYFCCAPCIDSFKKDPETYMKKLEGIVLEDAPVTQSVCPVSGQPINKNVYSDHEGNRIFFCCESCKAKVEKNPGDYLKKMDS